LNQQFYAFSNDIWSADVILYQMTTGGFSFEYHEEHEYRNPINKKDIRPITDKFLQQYWNFVFKMLKKYLAKG
jgi:hypothetical protein